MSFMKYKGQLRKVFDIAENELIKVIRNDYLSNYKISKTREVNIGWPNEVGVKDFKFFKGLTTKDFLQKINNGFYEEFIYNQLSPLNKNLETILTAKLFADFFHKSEMIMENKDSVYTEIMSCYFAHCHVDDKTFPETLLFICENKSEISIVAGKTLSGKKTVIIPQPGDLIYLNSSEYHGVIPYIESTESFNGMKEVIENPLTFITVNLT